MIPRDPEPVNRDDVAWPDWADYDRWTTVAPGDDSDRWTITEFDDGPRPTAPIGVAPDAWSEQFHRGFMLGLDGEDPVTPTGLSGYLARAFEAGVAAGRRAFDRHIDERYADRVGDGPRETDGYAPSYCS